MAGFLRMLAAVVVFFLITNAASAFGVRSISYSYYVVPYYYCPPLPAVTVIPVDVPGIHAVPTPAPPSQTVEPPQLKPAKVESVPRSADDRRPVIIATRSRSSERCRVGFWNVTGRDVTLAIAGKSWKIAKDQSLTLDLERQFAWQIDGGAQRVERVAEGQASYEVVIRE